MILLLGMMFCAGLVQGGRKCHLDYSFEKGCNGNMYILDKSKKPILTSNNCGTLLDRKFFKSHPTVSYKLAKPVGELYTLVLLESDTKLEKGVYYLRWAQANISGKVLADGNSTDGKAIFKYVKPGEGTSGKEVPYSLLLFKHKPDTKIERSVHLISNNTFGLENWLSFIEEKEKSAICQPEAYLKFTIEL